MNVLITGGAGFVGRNFHRRLGVRDTVDIQSPALFHEDFREFIKLYGPDDYGYDLIIHCAAVVGGRLNIEQNPIGVATDLSIDADLFNWLVKHNYKGKLIYFSSSAVYPIELQTRKGNCFLAEEFVSFAGTRFGLPDMTYGWSKLTGEYLAQHAVKAHGLDVVIYRPFSGYGADQDLTYPFPSIIDRVRRREDPLTIWGSGEQMRDFIHIDDIVTCVLETYQQLPPGTALNLGTGVSTSFKDLARLAANIAGYRPEIICDETKPEGVFCRVADTFAMRQFYQPKITLEEGIRRALDIATVPV